MGEIKNLTPADYFTGMARMKYADIDRIYRDIPLDSIPWYIGTPPDALVALAGK